MSRYRVTYEGKARLSVVVEGVHSATVAEIYATTTLRLSKGVVEMVTIADEPTPGIPDGYALIELPTDRIDFGLIEVEEIDAEGDE